MDILDQPVVRTYILYSAILALKLLGTALLTASVRYSKKVFANPEDAKYKGGEVKLDSDVERIRRAHLNDLENIPAFWVLAALYLTTNPGPAIATILFRVYTLGRFLHTFVYAVMPLPQPARSYAFRVPFAISVYMGLQVVWFYISSL